MADPELMSATAAAAYLGLSFRSLRRLTDHGEVPVWVDPDTGRRRYSRKALDRWQIDGEPSRRLV